MRKLILLVTLIGVINCDLPVHCVESQIQGQWKLFVSAPKSHGVGLVPCGHSIPDNPDNSYLAGIEDFKSSYSIDVDLQTGGLAQILGDNKQPGTWTMVYDEGFEINLHDVKYFSFSKYQPEGNSAKSFCDQTLIGWYNNQKNGDRGCYRAEKSTKVEESESLQSANVVQPDYMKQDDLNKLGFLQVAAKIHGDKHKQLNKDDHEQIVERLNNIEGSWTAKVYDHMIGKSFAQINQSAGRKRFYQGPKYIKQSSFIQTSESYKHLDRESLSDLPKSFSLKEYIGHPKAQEDCGACYTISTMEMLSARLKMQGINVDLSPQHSLNCNYYNQGCGGGYPFLVAKFASEQYLVSESAVPYLGRDGNCDMSVTKTASTVYQATNYRYVGGRYGKSSEKQIMEELMEKGPVVMNFEPTYEFMYYERGIYHSKDAATWIMDNQAKPNWVNLKNQHIFYQQEKVDHSVLCYGWGEENGEKYWLLLNSWGSDWGEKGSFRMRRGTDESAIESMAEAADPIAINLKADSSSNHNDTKKKETHQQSSRETVDDILLYGTSFSDIDIGFTAQNYNSKRYE